MDEELQQDKKQVKRMFLLQQEVERDCKRYNYECRDLGTHKATKKEIEYYTYLVSKLKILRKDF